MSRLICVFAGLVTLALALPATAQPPADGPQSGIRRGPQGMGPRLQSTIKSRPWRPG